MFDKRFHVPSALAKVGVSRAYGLDRLHFRNFFVCQNQPLRSRDTRLQSQSVTQLQSFHATYFQLSE